MKWSQPSANVLLPMGAACWRPLKILGPSVAVFDETSMLRSLKSPCAATSTGPHTANGPNETSTPGFTANGLLSLPTCCSHWEQHVGRRLGPFQPGPTAETSMLADGWDHFSQARRPKPACWPTAGTISDGRNQHVGRRLEARRPKPAPRHNGPGPAPKPKGPKQPTHGPKQPRPMAKQVPMTRTSPGVMNSKQC